MNAIGASLERDYRSITEQSIPNRKIETQGNEGQSLFLDLSDQAANLFSVEQKLPRPQRVMVKLVRMVVRADVGTVRCLLLYQLLVWMLHQGFFAFKLGLRIVLVPQCSSPKRT